MWIGLEIQLFCNQLKMYIFLGKKHHIFTHGPKIVSIILFLTLNFISQLSVAFFTLRPKQAFTFIASIISFCDVCCTKTIQNWLTSNLSTWHLLINWHASHISVFISRLCLAFHYHSLPCKNDSTWVHPETSAVSCSFFSVRRSN